MIHKGEKIRNAMSLSAKEQLRFVKIHTFVCVYETLGF
jgi:hypothetical protein